MNKKARNSIRAGSLATGAMALCGLGIYLTRASPSDYVIAQAPLFVSAAESPLMMLVMSRDEQLFTKAYADYTDLNGDGVLDTTYQDAFEYAGYFDSNLCYARSSDSFVASERAVGAHAHACSGKWSGNFLNWVSMSRLDMVRHVLYGGKRTVDTPERTVLQRADVPNDAHAWVKVYSQSDIKSFTPLSTTSSFCNASINGTPLIRVASGSFSEWASTESIQCVTKAETTNGLTQQDVPAQATNYSVNIEVCRPGSIQESFCKSYTAGKIATSKPIGLLQEHGEGGKLRFGLMTGSQSRPRSGAVLRRNVGMLANNRRGTLCAPGDEINTESGVFCEPGPSKEGIINTLNTLALSSWAGQWGDCSGAGRINRQSQGSVAYLNNPGAGSGAAPCSAWGNPLAEAYTEAVRYVQGQSPTSAYNGPGDLTGLTTNLAWLDPYRPKADGGNSYCAKCSILVINSGAASFDSDEIASLDSLPDAISATNSVGSMEGINGNAFAGRVGLTPVGASLDTHADICKPQHVSQLGLVRGLCPEAPSYEGSYMSAGAAFAAHTSDVRRGKVPAGRPAAVQNLINTYAVTFEPYPSFSIPVGAGQINISPVCQALAKADAKPSDPGWRTCSLVSVGVGARTSTVAPRNVYGRDEKYVDGRRVAGSFSLAWEDTPFGSDHDNDMVTMLTYCVGSSCSDKTNPQTSYSGKHICWNSDSRICTAANGSPTVGAAETLVRVEVLSGYGSHATLNGFTATGSAQDGTVRELLRPAGKNGSIINVTGNPVSGIPGAWSRPKVYKLSAGTGAARTLESPLWYATKYGGFKDYNKNGVPDPGEWDSQEKGKPDNYFVARDPSKLREALNAIFSEASGGAAPTAGGSSGARVSADSITVDATFSVTDQSNDWSGDVVAYEVSNSGGQAGKRWSAASVLPEPAARRIFFNASPTHYLKDGSIGENGNAISRSLSWNNLGSSDDARAAAVGLIVSPESANYPQAFTALEQDGGNKLVDYLRGSSIHEISKGGPLRSRTTALGDIVNSAPAIVAGNDSYGYSAWSTAATPTWKQSLGRSYAAYLTNTKRLNYPSPSVYVGANDGMLHAFEGKQGHEQFAFVPSAARASLWSLADPRYTHHFFVDGRLTVGDVPTSATGGWKTVLVGSTGAGSQSVFGLDITTPSAFTEKSTLWEVRGGSGPGQVPDLGNVLGKAAIVPVNDHGHPRWVAIFGNGVNSVTGAPTLIVIDVATGQILRRLAPKDQQFARRNGLINVAAFSVRPAASGLVDTIYGGDLQGNLWKFDLSGEAPDRWSVAYAEKPLFQAIRDDLGQPITGDIEAVSGPGGNTLILFGTGQYFAEGDNATGSGNDTPIESLYGILDQGRRIGDRSALVAQTIKASSSSGAHEIRSVSSHPVDYTVMSGWYVDLVVEDVRKAERFFGTPRVQNGKVFFTTYITGEAVCSFGGGKNWLYGLNLLSGAGGLDGTSLTPGGDPACTADCGGISLNPGDTTSPPIRETSLLVPTVTPPPLCNPADPNCDFDQSLEEHLAGAKCSLVIRAPGTTPLYLPRLCGRQSWRQLR
jgi:type IV pilus assembly protein PilY1